MSEARDQSITDHLGMWVFLASEALLFGALFIGYWVFRHSYPDVFRQGARTMEFWAGTINTAVLLLSSLFMAIGDRAVRAGRGRLVRSCLLATLLLGAVFLGIKAYEYQAKFAEHLMPGAGYRAPPGSGPRLQVFLFLYFAMTGLHALHMIAGLVAVSWLVWRQRRGRLTAAQPEPVAIVGLYWHFVDCIWVFLYPLFYLAGR